LPLTEAIRYIHFNNFNNGGTMSNPTREALVGELEERVRDTLYQGIS